MTPSGPSCFKGQSDYNHLGMGQNPIPLVNIKIAGKWMFIPLKMVLIGIDPYPFHHPTLTLDVYHLVMTHIANWKITIFFIGKASISMGHGFHGYVKQTEGNHVVTQRFL